VPITCGGKSSTDQKNGRIRLCIRPIRPFSAPLAPQQVSLDFCNQKRQVGLHKAQLWRDDTIVFDAGLYMFVMGVGAL
jgi:hypothetical protein